MDISISNFSLQINGLDLLTNTDLKISQGFKYGLIGHNGSGKSILLKYISNPEFTKNYKFDIFW